MARNEHIVGRDRVAINIARFKVGSEEFQIVVDPDKAIALKEGAALDIREVLESEEIFSDAQKGNIASEQELEKVFGTTDRLGIAEQIIKKGEIQVTSEHREKVREEKRKRIVEIIHRNGVDPKTGHPHPPTRIENAFAEAKIRIDDSKRAEDQVQDVLKKIREVLPISFETRKIAVHIPAEYAAKSYGTMKSFGDVVKNDWQNDGSLIIEIKIAAGLQEDFFSELNNLTHGNAETKIISTS